MAYEKQEWKCGDVVTAEKLNHMEDGIAEAGGGSEERTIMLNSFDMGKSKFSVDTIGQSGMTRTCCFIDVPFDEGDYITANGGNATDRTSWISSSQVARGSAWWISDVVRASFNTIQVIKVDENTLNKFEFKTTDRGGEHKLTDLSGITGFVIGNSANDEAIYTLFKGKLI